MTVATPTAIGLFQEDNRPSQTFKLANFINGEFVAPSNGEYFDNYDPSCGKVYSKIPDSQPKDVATAVEAADAALPAWSALTAQDRSKYMNRIADAIEARLEEFAIAESRDQGKPVWLARTVDIPRAVANFRFFAGEILHHTDNTSNLNGQAVNFVSRSPLGVVGLISPWNLPLYLLTWKIAPCISVGNTCVAKPSELTSVTAFMMCEIFQQVGLPKGVVNIVLGNGPNVGAPLVEHPVVRGISFTGGTVTAKDIIRRSAEHTKKLSLELGGKNAGVIFADADIDECINTSVRSAFANQGEICLCTSRLLVEESIFDEFVDKYTAAVSQLKVGDPKDPNTKVGALNSEGHWKKVLGYVEKAKAEGGTIRCGGKVPADTLPADCRSGYYLAPTVVTGLNPRTAACNQEEIFGPVVTISPFKGEAEAVEIANCTKYGLAATVWSRDGQKCLRVSHKLRAGTVWVNCWMMRDLRVPFGGVKASGIGSEGGEFSIDFYTETKNICLKY